MMEKLKKLVRDKLEILKKLVRDKLEILKILLKENYKPLLVIFVILLLIISAILRANFKYIDDSGRALDGYRGWGDFSRYLSSFLSIFIHGGSTYLTDISPFTQILAIFIMSCASLIVIRLFSNKQKINIFNIICIIPLTINPYFLECLSYKFDSPYMAISVLFSIFPFIFYGKKPRYFITISIISLLIMCLTYQASSGIYLLMIIFISLKKWKENKKLKDIFKFICISIISFVSSLLLFKLFFMKSDGNYVDTTLFPLLKLPLGFIDNLFTYYEYVFSDFRFIWILLFLGITILYILGYTINTKQKKLVTFILSVLGIFCGFVCAFGIYPAFTKPLFVPRAMYGLGVFISLVMIQCINFERGYISRILCLVLTYMFITFSFTYGNALYEQKVYTDYRIQMVMSSINELDIMNNEKIKNIKIQGNIGQAKIIRNMAKDYNMLNRLIPSTFGENWYWSQHYFLNYFNLKNINVDNTNNLSDMDLPILKDTMLHTIKGNEDNILIVLKE